MTDIELRNQISRYQWYHVVEVAPGISTPGYENYIPIQRPVLEALRGLDLSGKRVLDIGCRDGLFSFEAERLGASEVIGIDRNVSPGAIEFLAPHFRSRVQFHEMNLLDLRPGSFGLFDIVIFAGVLYHLRYPFWALKLVRDIMSPAATVVVETAVFTVVEDWPLLCCPVGKESFYEPTSVTFFNTKGLVDTLTSLGIRTLRHSYLSDHQIPQDRATFVCQRDLALDDLDTRRYWDGTQTNELSRIRAGIGGTSS